MSSFQSTRFHFSFIFITSTRHSLRYMCTFVHIVKSIQNLVDISLSFSLSVGGRGREKTSAHVLLLDMCISLQLSWTLLCCHGNRDSTSHSTLNCSLSLQFSGMEVHYDLQSSIIMAMKIFSMVKNGF